MKLSPDQIVYEKDLIPHLLVEEHVYKGPFTVKTVVTDSEGRYSFNAGDQVIAMLRDFQSQRAVGPIREAMLEDGKMLGVEFDPKAVNFILTKTSSTRRVVFRNPFSSKV